MDRHTTLDIARKTILWYADQYLIKEDQHPDREQEKRKVQTLLTGSSSVFLEETRMSKIAFQELVRNLKNHGMNDTRDGSVEEQVMVFLFVVAKNISNRDVQHQFGHSGSTISAYFHSTLQAMYSFARTLLIQPSGSIIPPEIESNPKFTPFFHGCIGAIDGTHIPATIKGMSPIPFINRKGYKSQNCLATCSFDLQFQFMLPGWEGSAHDNHIISKALEKNQL